MAYTMLDNTTIRKRNGVSDSLEEAALSFIRERCEGLRFDKSKAVSKECDELDFDGTSLKAGQIPFNMEKDIDRLCLENAVKRFLKSGKKEDAFDVYFCYLEMFVGDYEKTRRMIELLSEFEANGSGLLMKHRDHYSHSVYVFVLGLAIFEANKVYREDYQKYYGIQDEHEAAAHYLQYWGLSSLFHDIGYPFELPFEQVCSYFEVNKHKRAEKITYIGVDGKEFKKDSPTIPFLSYNNLSKLTDIDQTVADAVSFVIKKEISNTDALFAYLLSESRMGKEYGINEEQMLGYLQNKPTRPDMFSSFMDHAYFSATLLFKKLFEELRCIKYEKMPNTFYCQAVLDSLTAILMHNSLYKFCIANPKMDPEKEGMHIWYKGNGNKPLKAELHPLAYMLMLCDELQCWDRTAYGRNSKKELHPMGCTFDFSNNQIKAVYLYDEKEMAKVNRFKDEYIEWLQNPEEKKKPELKAYSGMYGKKNGIAAFQEDIERIVDLSNISLRVETGLAEHVHGGNRSYLSDSNFLNLYNFAIILNGRWADSDWKRAKAAGQEDQFLNDDRVMAKYGESFKVLSLEYKLANINQAKAFARYMNEIDCFYTDKPVDFEQVDRFTDDELVKIGLLEHQRWLQDHYDMGWTFGEPDAEKRDFERRHKDMVPNFGGFDVSHEVAEMNYERLDKATQDKDTEPMECMLAMLKMLDGLRIYRL